MTEKVYSSTSWEALLPASKRGHIWLLLTLGMPDKQSRTGQVRVCEALRLWADSIVLVSEEC